MKNIFTLSFFLFLSILSFAQPQAINYQGVARDNQGHPLINQNIGLRLSILDSSATGQSVYVETQNTTTNNSGLFNIGIGSGNVIIGTFSSIPWGHGDKWLKIEMDIVGGSNYVLIGTTQFLSVPYALHANTANSISTINSSQGTFTMISNISINLLNNYVEAMYYCSDLIEGGYSDWRLPSIDEIYNYYFLYGTAIKISCWLPQRDLYYQTANGTSNGFFYYKDLYFDGPNYNIPSGGNTSRKTQCVR